MCWLLSHAGAQDRRGNHCGRCFRGGVAGCHVSTRPGGSKLCGACEYDEQWQVPVTKKTKQNNGIPNCGWLRLLSTGSTESRWSKPALQTELTTWTSVASRRLENKPRGFHSLLLHRLERAFALPLCVSLCFSVPGENAAGVPRRSRGQGRVCDRQLRLWLHTSRPGHRLHTEAV